MSDPERARLLWQCRRGMLELDLMLRNFVHQGYDALNEQQQDSFQQLLREADQTLLEYLMGRVTPDDREIAHVVARIRNTPFH